MRSARRAGLFDRIDRRFEQEGVMHRRADPQAAFDGEASGQAHHLGAVRLHRQFMIDRGLTRLVASDGK